MAKIVKITDLDSSIEFSFNSTTDSTSIVVSDDAFSIVVAMKELTDAIARLTSRLGR